MVRLNFLPSDDPTPEAAHAVLVCLYPVAGSWAPQTKLAQHLTGNSALLQGGLLRLQSCGGNAVCGSPATCLPPTMVPGTVSLCRQCPNWLVLCRGPLANRVAASDAASARAADGTTRDAEHAGRPALWRSVAAALQLSDAQRTDIAAAWRLLRWMPLCATSIESSHALLPAFPGILPLQHALGLLAEHS